MNSEKFLGSEKARLQNITRALQEDNNPSLGVFWNRSCDGLELRRYVSLHGKTPDPSNPPAEHRTITVDDLLRDEPRGMEIERVSSVADFIIAPHSLAGQDPRLVEFGRDMQRRGFGIAEIYSVMPEGFTLLGSAGTFEVAEDKLHDQAILLVRLPSGRCAVTVLRDEFWKIETRVAESDDFLRKFTTYQTPQWRLEIHGVRKFLRDDFLILPLATPEEVKFVESSRGFSQD